MSYCLDYCLGCLVISNILPVTGYKMIQVVSNMLKGRKRSHVVVQSNYIIKIRSLLLSSWIVSDSGFWCRAKFNVDDMCRDQWNWASKNPYGYEPPEGPVEDPFTDVWVVYLLLQEKFIHSCFNFKKMHVTEVQENSLFILVCQFYFRKLATLFACTWPGGRSILNLIGAHFSVAGTTWRSGLIFLKTNVDWPKVRSFHKNFENGGVQFLPITWGRVWFLVNK